MVDSKIKVASDFNYYRKKKSFNIKTEITQFGKHTVM